MKKKIDWEFIQSEYEETDKSIRRIAEENGVSEGTIRSRIKKNKWEKCSRSSEVTQMLVTKSRSIGGVAAKKVREIVEILGERYNPSFEPMIVVFTSNYEMWLELNEKMRISGMIDVTSKGTKQASIEFIMMKEVEKTLREYASYIGLSMSEAMQLGLKGTSDQTDTILSDLGKKVSQRKIEF